jgi:hypothetical protein
VGGVQSCVVGVQSRVSGVKEKVRKLSITNEKSLDNIQGEVCNPSSSTESNDEIKGNFKIKNGI